MINARQGTEKYKNITKNSAKSVKKVTENFKKRIFKTQKKVKTVRPKVSKMYFKKFGSTLIITKRTSFKLNITPSISRFYCRYFLISKKTKPIQKIFIEKGTYA